MGKWEFHHCQLTEAKVVFLKPRIPRKEKHKFPSSVGAINVFFFILGDLISRNLEKNILRGLLRKVAMAMTEKRASVHY
jgi:hypothetical protein